MRLHVERSCKQKFSLLFFGTASLDIVLDFTRYVSCWGSFLYLTRRCRNFQISSAYSRGGQTFWPVHRIRDYLVNGGPDTVRFT